MSMERAIKNIEERNNKKEKAHLGTYIFLLGLPVIAFLIALPHLQQ